MQLHFNLCSDQGINNLNKDKQYTGHILFSFTFIWWRQSCCSVLLTLSQDLSWSHRGFSNSNLSEMHCQETSNTKSLSYCLFFFVCEQKLSARSRFDTCALPLTSPASNLIKNSGEKTLLFVCRLIFKTKNRLTRTGMKAAHRESEVRGAEVSQERKKEIKLCFFWKAPVSLWKKPADLNWW